MKTNNFFYENGEYKAGSIPVEVLEDCYHSGACDSDVAYWIERLNFDFDKQQGIDYLKEYGAWDEKQLQDHKENKHRVLWLFAGDYADDQPIYGLIH